MKKAKVKPADLARFLDIERSYIYKIMKGKQKPSSALLGRIRYLTMQQVKTFDDLIEELNAEKEKRTNQEIFAENVPVTPPSTRSSSVGSD